MVNKILKKKQQVVAFFISAIFNAEPINGLDKRCTLTKSHGLRSHVSQTRGNAGHNFFLIFLRVGSRMFRRKKADHRMLEPFLNYFSGIRNLHTTCIHGIMSPLHGSDVNIFFPTPILIAIGNGIIIGGTISMDIFE